MTMKTVVVTGAGGQLGQTLQRDWVASGLGQEFQLRAFSHEELDCSDESALATILEPLQCSAIINAAAYTQVDRAEQEAGLAYSVNEAAVRNLAIWCLQNQARLIHISTDFVFDGKKNSPYEESDLTAPLGVYGKSKQAGEQVLLEAQQNDALDMAMIRASWLYSSHGSNFVKTMLRLMAEKEEARVVIDQVGSPTSTHSLAAVIFALLLNGDAGGIFHWCDGAEISWYDFALAIQKIGLEKGILATRIPVRPIPTEAYPTAAQRPAYSVLDRSRALHELAIQATDWRQELDRVLTEIAIQA